MADALNNPKNVSIKKFNSYRVRKDLYKDQLSLNNLEIKLNEAGFYIPRTIETTEIFRLNISKLADYLSPEVKNQIVIKMGSGFKQTFVTRDIYNNDKQEKVGQLIHTRGKMADGTFVSVAKIDGLEIEDSKFYFSDGQQVQGIYSNNEEDITLKLDKRFICSSCPYFLGAICSAPGNKWSKIRKLASTCLSSCLRLPVKFIHMNFLCSVFCFLGGFTLCYYGPEKACRIRC